MAVIDRLIALRLLGIWNWLSHTNDRNKGILLVRIGHGANIAARSHG